MQDGYGRVACIVIVIFIQKLASPFKLFTLCGYKSKPIPTLMKETDEFELIVSLLGFRFVERDVSLDKSDVGGMYSEYDCYSRAPFPVQRYPQDNGTYVTKYLDDKVWRQISDYDTQDKIERLNNLDYLFHVLHVVQREHLHSSTMGGSTQGYWAALHPQGHPGSTSMGEGIDMATALRRLLVAFAIEAEMVLPEPNPVVVSASCPEA